MSTAPTSAGEPASRQSPSAPGATPPRDNTRAILAMTFAMGAFVVSDALVKVVGGDLSLGQIMLLRGLIASSLMLGGAIGFGWLPAFVATIRGPLRTRLFLRTGSEVGASFCFFTGMLSMPFADNAAIGQLAPLAVTAGAALFLGEQVGWRRWLATVIGFVGVLIIIQPGTTAFQWAGLWTLASVAFIAMRDLLTARLSLAVPAHHIVALTTFVVTVASLGLVAVQPWRPVLLWHVGYLAMAAVGVLVAFHAVVVAMRSGELSVVGPFRYSVILYATLLGVLVFKEALTASSLVGMAIVIGAGLYTAYREQVRRREAAQRARAPVAPS